MRTNFARANLGLAKIAIARKQNDEAIPDLQTALQWNPNDLLSLQLLALQQYQRGEYAEGEKCLDSYLANLPSTQRQKAAEQFINQLDKAGKHEAAAKAQAAAKLPAEKAAKQ